MTCLDGNATSPTWGWDVSRAAFDTIMLLLVSITNAAILAIVARRWSADGMPLSNVTSSLLVINLSAADFLVGVLGVLHFLPRYLCGLEETLSHSRELCVLRFALVITAHLASGYTLVAIAVDRYVAVCHALNYRDIVTPRRSLALIACIWVAALAASMVLFVWNNWDGSNCDEDKILPLEYTLICGLFGQFIILGVVTWAHCCVHRVVLQLRSRARLGQRRGVTGPGVMGMGVGMGAGMGAVASGDGVSGGVGGRDDRVGTRAARVLAVILAVYVASWAPFMIVLIVRTCRVHVSETVMETASSIVNFNYLINPFVYAYNNRPIKKTIHKCVSSIKRKVIDSWIENSNSVSFSKE